MDFYLVLGQTFSWAYSFFVDFFLSEKTIEDTLLLAFHPQLSTISPQLLALPQNPVVIAESATFAAGGNQLEITAADGSIIEWDSFSIAPIETVHFIQPNSASAVFNRVTRSDPSNLLGVLQANGNVILINPNGIVFGENAIINTGTLVASCFDLLNEPFHASRQLRFSGTSSFSGSIELGGVIEVQGDFIAVGRSIMGNGVVRAENGDIGLFGLGGLNLNHSGSNVFFHKMGSQGFEYSIASHQTLMDVPIQSPDFGAVFISNEMQALGGPSPSIYALGALIFLTEEGRLAATGDANGGRAFIGGAPLGDPAFPSKALNTLMAPGSIINVSAPTSGNGGTAYLWSTISTQFYGDIFAQGGAAGGDGGFVEISGLGHLDFNGTVNTEAPMGAAGQLLIDPTDVTIGPANMNVIFPPPPPVYTGSPAVVSAAALIAALNGATNVTISTSAPNDQGQAGTITVLNPVNWNSIRTLTLTADQDIIVRANLENSGTGAVTLTAARDVSIDALGGTVNVVVGARNGPINITAGRDFLLRAGTAAAAPLFAAVGTAAAAVNTGTITINVARNASVLGGTGAVAIAAPNSAFALIGGFTSSTRQINLTVGNDLLIQGGVGGVQARGAAFALVGSYTGTNNGNINVKVGHDFTIVGGTQIPGLTTFTPCAGIARYGEGLSVVGTTTATDFNVDVGNNLTMVGGSIVLTAPTSGPATAMIGYGGFQLNPAAIVNLGNININVGHNFEMRSGVGAGAAHVVGGTQRPCQGNITINVGENMWMHNATPAQNAFIGASIGGSGTRTPWALNFFVTVGKTLTIDARNGSFVDWHCFNGLGNYVNQGIVQAHIGGDLVFIGGSAANIDIATIWLHPNLINEIWVGGNWRAYNGAVLFTQNQGGVEPNTLFNPLANIGRPDWRAGGNIGIAGASTVGIATPLTLNQPITIIADHPFAPGQLWTPKSAIVNGVNIFTGTPLGAASGNISTVAPFHGGGDGLGAVFVDANCYNFSVAAFPTTVNGPTWSIATPIPPAPPTTVNNFLHKFFIAGLNSAADLLISSQDFYDDATPADFPIGAVPGTVQVQSPFGNVTVEGFRDIVITDLNSAIADVGNVTIQSVRDILPTASQTVAGNTISLTAGRNISMNAAIMLAGINITQTADDNIFLTDSTETALTGNLASLAGNDSSLVNSSVFADLNIDWVIDNDFPAPPLIGASGFNMDATSSFSVTAGYIRVYTARQSQNTIDPLAQFISNGVPFTFIPGTLFQDTNQEQWCTYYPDGSLGVPFRIFYKDCLQEVTEQATIIVQQFLFDLDDLNWPYYGMDEFYGWPTKFFIVYDLSQQMPYYQNWPAEPYFLRKRNSLLLAPRSEEARMRWSPDIKPTRSVSNN